MPITSREMKKGSIPKTLFKEEARKLLADGVFFSFDTKKHPDLDILIALGLYPNSTYQDLLDKGFERFENTWDSYISDLLNDGLVKKSPEDKYSLSEGGEEYLYQITLIN